MNTENTKNKKGFAGEWLATCFWLGITAFIAVFIYHHFHF